MFVSARFDPRLLRFVLLFTASTAALDCRAGAQLAPGVQKAPPSVTHRRPQKLTGSTGAIPHNVPQQDVGDAVIADALSRIDEQSDEHFHQGEFNHSINLARIIVQGDPRNMEAYANSAWLLWSTDRNDEAIAFLKQGLDANPDTYYMYDELGEHYYIHLKQYADAVPYFEKAITFKDAPFMTWHGLAHCYEKLNQWDRAVQTWEQACNFPNDVAGPPNLKRARAELAKRQASH